MTDIRYYIKSPNGRERLKARSDLEAKQAFKKHYTATAGWICDGKRELVKETRETLLSEAVKQSYA